MAAKIEDLKAYCQHHNIRLTTIREHVLFILLDSSATLGAYEILEKLKVVRPSAEAMTVYRALNFLTEHHLAHKIDATNKYAACCHPEAEYCLLLICTQCGKKFEAHDAGLHQSVLALSQQRNFVIAGKELEVYGVCEGCSA